MYSENSIDVFDGYSLDELFEELGSVVMSESLGFAADDPDESRKFGRDWFERNLDKIRAQICLKPAIVKLLGDSGGERAVGFVSAASAALGEVAGSHQASIVLSFIVMRYGVKRLCSG